MTDQPRTAAGRALLADWLDRRRDHPPNTARARDLILAIEDDYDREAFLIISDARRFADPDGRQRQRMDAWLARPAHARLASADEEGTT